MNEVPTPLTSTNEVAAIYKRKTGYIAVARAFVRDNTLAEDIFHDSILYLLENLGRLSGENISAYFSKVLASKCLDVLKQRKRHQAGHENMKHSLLEREMESILASRAEDGIILRSDLIERFNACKRQLPQLTVEIFISSRISGLTHKEIAKSFGLSTRRVNSEISAALKVFREEFRDYLPVVLLLMAIHF